MSWKNFTRKSYPTKIDLWNVDLKVVTFIEHFVNKALKPIKHRLCYHLHFIDKENETQMLGDLPKVIESVW